jgi:hypothetical protein
MTAKAWLAGDRHDLQYLATMLPSGVVQVTQDGGGLYLAFAELDNPSANEQFYEVARKLITRINGLARSQNPAFLPVDLSDSYERDGGVTAVGATARLVARAYISATAEVTGPDGVPKPQAPHAGPGYLVLAARNPDVAEVLRIMRKPEDPHFAELYKVWEIVRGAGGMDAAMQAARVSNNAISRFTRTANHQAASGGNARHARLPQAPPKTPMPIGEAEAMIGRLVGAWIASL